MLVEVKKVMEFKDTNSLNHSFIIISLSRLNHDLILNQHLELLNMIAQDLNDSIEGISDKDDSVEEFNKILFSFSKFDMLELLSRKAKQIQSFDISSSVADKTQNLISNIVSNIQNFTKYYLDQSIALFNLNQLLELLQYFFKLFPNDREIIPEIIHNIFRQEDIFIKDDNSFLDISTLVTALLTISRYSLKLTAKEDYLQKQIKETGQCLARIYDEYHTKKEYLAKAEALNTKNMYNDELCSLILSYSIMRLKDSLFMRHLLREIRKRIEFTDKGKEELTTSNYIQLLSASKYIFSLNTDEDKDFYYLIHDKLWNSKSHFSNSEIELIKKIVRNDQIILESNFLV